MAVSAADLWDPEVDLGKILEDLGALAWESSQGWKGERNEAYAKALGLHLRSAAGAWREIYGG